MRPSSALTGATLATYSSNVSSAGQWIASHSTLPDGAILYSSKKIVPYYSNLAAIGLTRNPANYPQVKAWMEWHIRHLNATDVWDLGNSMYDYNVSRGVETPLNTADSTDSYPATFMTLAWEFCRTADPSAQSYVKSILRELDLNGPAARENPAERRPHLGQAEPSHQVPDGQLPGLPWLWIDGAWQESAEVRRRTGGG